MLLRRGIMASAVGLEILIRQSGTPPAGMDFDPIRTAKRPVGYRSRMSKEYCPKGGAE
jgi:hypothetical protein